ncbi:MAG TPA: 30S ribosomal protein S18 [Patescibacteria group bacterium]|nr:30S ribosomal protein S18 [Patescibacteria group bacterium]
MPRETKKYCFFCKNKIDEIDFTDAQILRKYLNFSGRIQPRTRTGTCSKHQKKLTKAIKRARQLDILNYTKA